MARHTLRAALCLACVASSLSFAPTALLPALSAHKAAAPLHRSPFHASLQRQAPLRTARGAAAGARMSAPGARGGEAEENLAKQRALQANREQWGITEPLSTGKEQQGSAAPPKPPSKRGTSGFSRDDLHLSRKAFHIIGGVFFALTRLLLSRWLYVSAIGTVGFLTFAFEICRLQFPRLNKVIIGALGKVMRDHEADQFSGMAYYATGVATTCFLFDETIAVIGILSLAIGDPAASFCGQTSGRFLTKKHWMVKKVLPGKSIAGILGFICSVALLNALVLFPTGALTVPVFAALIMAPAVIGSMVEVFIPSPQLCLPYKSFPLGLDDNFLLPVCTAAAAHVAWAALGGGAPPPALRRFILF